MLQTSHLQRQSTTQALRRGEPLSSAMSLLAILITSVFVLDALAAFHAAYQRASLRLEDERWLLDNCRDPTFFSKMRAHTNVCYEVEANARLGVGWAALRDVSNQLRLTLHSFITPLASFLLPFLQPWLLVACCGVFLTLLLTSLGCCALWAPVWAQLWGGRLGLHGCPGRAAYGRLKEV